MSFEAILLVPGFDEGLSFRQALTLLAPYSPRLALNFESPTNSLWTDAGRTAALTTLGTGIAGATNHVTGASVHAAQSNSVRRPTWGRFPTTGTRNLLTWTEDFSNAAWVKTNITANANTLETLDPFGGSAATKLTASSAVIRTAQNFASGEVAGNSWVFSFYVKAGTTPSVSYLVSNGLIESSISEGSFTFGTQTFSGALGTYVTSRTASDAGGGWFLITLFCTVPVGQTAIRFNVAGPTSGNTSYVFGAMAERGSVRTNYQKVTTAFDVTESGAKDVYGVRFDGTDDGLEVAGLDLSNTDEVTIIGGFRWLSGTGMVIEHTSSFALNNGSFHILVGTDEAVTGWQFKARGDGAPDTTQRSYITAANPRSAAVSAYCDISTDLIRVVENSFVSTDNSADDKGAGNFANSTLYIGLRGGLTLPYNGWCAPWLFICGSIVPDAIYQKIARAMAKKLGLSI